MEKLIIKIAEFIKNNVHRKKQTSTTGWGLLNKHYGFSREWGFYNSFPEPNKSNLHEQ